MGSRSTLRMQESWGLASSAIVRTLCRAAGIVGGSERRKEGECAHSPSLMVPPERHAYSLSPAWASFSLAGDNGHFRFSGTIGRIRRWIWRSGS